MIVVADSSPLHYLILVEQAEILPRLYESVLIPDAVVEELRAAGSPSIVRQWLSEPHPWLRIVAVSVDEIATVSDKLDDGERAAIALAERTRADLLLIDDSDGRAEAKRRSLRVTGTLGVLRAAADAGLLDVRDVVERLRSTNFYVDEAVLRRVLGEI